MAKKRFLAILLSVLLLIQAMPMNALAAGVVRSNTLRGADYHDVSFVVDGDTIAHQLVEDGAALSVLPEDPALVPEDPSEASYKFTGWEDEAGNAVTAGTVVNSDLTVTAQFDLLKKYTVNVSYVYYSTPDAEPVAVADNVKRQYTVEDPEDVIESPASAVIPGGYELIYPTQASITVTPADLTADQNIEVVYKLPDVEYKIHHCVEGSSEPFYTQEGLEGSNGAVITPAALTAAVDPVFENYVFVSTSQIELDHEKENVGYVYYTAKDYTLTYDSQGGSYVAPIIAPYGSEVTVHNGGTYDEEVVCSIEEHTHSRQNGCYNYRGTLTCTKTEHTHSSSCNSFVEGTISPKPTRTGYTFAGWYLDADCTTPAAAKMDLMGDTTVYAKWEGKTVNYTVVYQKEVWDNATNSSYYAFESSAVKTAVVGEEVTATDDKDYSYYSNPTLTSAVVEADGSTVVYAKYPLTRYDIVFSLDQRNTNTNESNSATWTGKAAGYTQANPYTLEDVVLGQDVSAKWPTPDMVKYTTPLYGWINPNDSNTTYVTKRFEIVEIMLPTSGSSITYTASYSDKSEYYVRYWLQNPDGNGYTVEDRYSQVVATSSNLSAKELYGFTNVSKPSGSQYPSSGTSITVNGETYSGFNFYYNRDKFSITYMYKDSTLKTTENVYFGADISGTSYTQAPAALPEGVDSQAIFAGWYDNAGCTGDAYNFAYMPGNNLVLYAKYEMPDKKVNLDLNYEGADNTTLNPNPIIVKKHSTVSLPVPEREGYIFQGWYTAAEGGSLFDVNQPISMSEESMTLYAHWKMGDLSYVVKYVNAATGEELHASKTVTNSSFTLGMLITEESVSVDGYRVDAMRKSINLKITGNEIVFEYVERAAVNYTVIHQYADGTVIESETLEADGATERVVAFPIKVEGYYPDANVKSKVLASDAEQNVIVFTYAPYKRATLTVNHYYQDKDADGKALSTYSVNAAEEQIATIVVGDSIIASEYVKTFDPATYVFDHYGEGTTTKYVMTTDDNGKSYVVDIYYNINIFEVSYSYTGTVPAGAPAVPAAEQHTVSENVAVKTAPTLDGYIFSGWTTEDAAVADGAFAMPANNVAFTGSWTVRTDLSYTVNYYWNGTTEKVAESKVVGDQTFGTDVTEQAIEVDGYTLASEAEKTITIKTSGNEINFYYYKNVELTANSDTDELYDGAEHVVNGFTDDVADADPAFEGVTASGTGVDAGEYTVTFNEGAVDTVDTTEKYIVTSVVDGELVIAKRNVTLTSATDSKVYDGTALTNSTVTVSDDGFAEGEGATYDVTGAQTEVGTSDNTFTYTLNEGTKADNYTITKIEGTLTVTELTDKVTVTITEHSGTEKYDGAEKTVTGYDVEISNPLYTEADFTFSGDATVKGTDAGTYDMELKAADFTNISKNFGNVEFVIVDGTLEITKRNVTLTSATDSKVYDGTALTNSTVTVSEDGFAEGEGATYDVTGAQTEVGSSANAFTYTLNEGTKADNYTITKTEGTLTVTVLTDKVTVTITEHSGTEKYDGTEKTVTGYDVSIDNDLYTEADFTFSGDATVKGTDAGAYAMELKAADFTNISKNFGNVEFVIVDGTLEITKRNVTLTSADDEKVYDGEALTNSTVTVSDDGFAEGEGATYDVTGTQTEVGSSANAFTYTLNEGTKADNYIITKTEGTLTVTELTDKVTVTITEHSGEFMYDGAEKTVTGYDVEISNSLYTEADFTFSGDATVKGTDAGTYNMELKAADFTNISKNFSNVEFVIVDGTLEITKRSVTLTSATDEKVYDGTALTNDEVTVSDDGFAEGEGATYDVTGTQTEVGSSANVFTYTLNEGTKADNYTITTVEGTLTVTELTDEVVVTITEHSATVEYDGNEHTVTGYDVAISNTLYTEADFTFSGNDSVSGTTVGTYPMELKPEDFKNINDNFANVKFVIVDGALTITAMDDEVVVTITEHSGEFEYDGTEKKVEGYDVTSISNDLYKVEDFTFSGNAVVTGTTVGTYPMELKPEDFKNINDNFANVKFVIVDGTLTITAMDDEVVVTITENEGEFTYDGTEKTVEGYEVTGISNTLYTVADFTFSGDDSVSATYVGTYPMELKPEDFANTNENFANVKFVIVDGELVIKPIATVITITADSNEKVYDGTALTDNGYTFTQNVLVEGDVLIAVVEGAITDVGTTANVVTSYKVMRGETDVTANYTFAESVDGTLEITKRPVTLTSATDSKVYDGTALTNDEVTVSGDGFAAGEGATYDVTGTQTTIGTSDNTFTYTLNEGTKAANYDITVVFGTLTVTALTDEVVVTITEHSNTVEYDGNEHTVTGYDVAISNPLYTEADFTFSGNDSVSGTTVGTYPMELKPEDFANTNENFANVTFVIVDGALTITPVAEAVVVTITEHSGEFEYDGTEKKVEGYDVTSISNDLYKVEDFTFSGNAVVTGTTVGTYPMELKPEDFTNINENFANVTFVIVDGTLTITAMDDEVVVTITEHSGEFEYDGTEKKVEGYDVTSISNELYTANDFTFSGNAVVTGTTVGTYPMELKPEDFANTNENFANVTFVIVDGTLTITAMDDEVVVTITEHSGEFEYDGTEKKVEGYDVTSISNELYKVEDFTFSGNAVVTGTTVGTYDMELKPEDFANTNENFANVKFVIVDGTLTITAMDDEVVVTITEHSGEFTYDGTEKTVEGYDVTEISNTLYTVNDFTFSGDDSVSATYVGTYPMELKPEDFENTNENFANVKFVIVDGELVIKPIATVITITADSNEKVYDGTALTDSGYTFTQNVLVNGDVLIAVVEGAITDVGTTANVVTSYKVLRGETDVTANYTFADSVDGTLEITKRNVLMVSADDEKIYDGYALTNDTVTVTGFVEGEGATYDVTGSQLYVGSSDNEFTYTLNENTKAGNYEIKVVFGTLTVTIPTDDSFVIRKSHDASKTYDLGDTVEFTIEATNVYAEAKTIVISEIEGVVITGESVFENVEPGKTVTTTAEWIVTQEAILAGEFTNTATATVDEDVYTADDTVNPAAPNPSLAVDKTTTSTPANGETYALGETISYKIVVTNDGNLTITDVVVTDELTGDEWTVESLIPGESAEFTAEYVVTEADILAGKVVNVATADGKNPSDVPTDPGEDPVEDPTDEPNPSLAVDKTTTSTPANGETYALGETISYKIVVTNDGNLTITDVVVTDELTGDEWTVESLIPGESAEFTAEYVVTEADILAGKVVNVATADGKNPSDDPTDPGEDPAEDPTDDPNPSLAVDKTTTSTPANGETYALGETISYKIVVTNDGNLTITDVVVTDELTGDEWTVESLIPGESAEFTAEYVVTEADILAGKVVNVATADGKNPSDDPTDPGEDPVEDPTDDPNPSLAVDKTTTSTPANGETYALGETISYKIVVTNDGNLTITDVVVTDELTGDEWTVESLIPGESKEFTAEYVVTEADILAGKVVNVATADGKNPSDVPTDPGEDPVEDPTDDPKPSLAVDKTTTSTPANGETYALGETISYKIVVTNDGNLTITDVVVTDELTGDEWTVESLIPGESAEFTAEYVVTEADILAGKVVNVATADGKNPSEDPTDPGEDPVEDPTDDIKVDMIVTKESDADENTGLGDTITYTITVTNAGNVPFTNVVVDDKLEGAVIVPAEGFTIDENGNAVFAQIAVGETVELTATYVVTEADLAVEEGAEVEAEITNVVTAVGDEIDNPKDEEPETFIPSGEASVTDEIVPYTVTVNYWYYWYDVVDTEVAAPSVVEQHFNGETYQIVSPVIEGYKATIEVVEGVMDGDIVIDVIYHRIRQHLTIHYVYEDGTTAAATYDKRIGVGNKYSVTSPYIPGFTASIQVVSGTMPNRDLVFTVIYVPDVYEVPMNIGNVTMNVGDCFE